MSKLNPVERWRRHIQERFTALEYSDELKTLRREGLTLLGRTDLLTAEEWSQQRYRQLRKTGKYLKWRNQCQKIAANYGLAPWTVEMAGLLKDYSPEETRLVIESVWARIRVVTDNQNPSFLQWLVYEAYKLGIRVIQHTASAEITLLSTDIPHDSLKIKSRPPRTQAFYMRVDIPLGYPPEAAADLSRLASNLAAELCRALGYPQPYRLRSSPLVQIAKQLKADKPRLTESETIDIIDSLHADEDTFVQDRKLHKSISSQKSRVRRRLNKSRKKTT